eukprot:COSAG02_NODE_3120_length_7329_cov_2.938866_4_plen_94_part_00
MPCERLLPEPRLYAGTIPASLGEMEELRMVDLSKNLFRALPNSSVLANWTFPAVRQMNFAVRFPFWMKHFVLALRFLPSYRVDIAGQPVRQHS